MAIRWIYENSIKTILKVWIISQLRFTPKLFRQVVYWCTPVIARNETLTVVHNMQFVNKGKSNLLNYIVT